MGAAFRAKRSRCVYLPAESSDSLDSSETASIDSDTEPDNDEEMAIFSGLAFTILLLSLYLN
jgi:hypothetical protein